MKIKAGANTTPILIASNDCNIKVSNNCSTGTSVHNCSPVVKVGTCEQGPQGPPGPPGPINETPTIGYVYCTDVTSTGGNVGNKTHIPDTVPSNILLSSAEADDNHVTVHFMAEGGAFYSPTVTVDGIICSNLAQYPDDRRMFYGSVDIIVDSSRDVAIISSTGMSTSVRINRAPAGPQISSIRFINGYPGSQTEVKRNDNFDIEVTFDPTGSEPTFLEILDSGACSYKLIDLSSTSLNWGTTHTIVISADIDSTGVATTALPASCIAKNALGTYGNSISTNESGGTTDGQHLINCNDVEPTFVDHITTYPVGQSAFKGHEIGSQQITVSNFSSIIYSSPNNDFIISNPTTYAETKTITCQNPGNYNVSIVNYKIIAYREQNGTQAIFTKNIRVADIAPVVTITQPNARLRSSPSGQSYTITATSNQELTSTFSLNVPVSGTWQGVSFTGGPSVFTQSITISDNDNKGTGAWNWNGSAPTNRANISATLSGNEVVAGFISRTLTIAAWPNRQVDIGTHVHSTANLIVENLSKGGVGPNGGTIVTYDSDLDNENDKYTILDNSNAIDPNGEIWYNKDQTNAVSNTSGNAQIIIEET